MGFGAAFGANGPAAADQPIASVGGDSVAAGAGLLDVLNFHIRFVGGWLLAPVRSRAQATGELRGGHASPTLE